MEGVNFVVMTQDQLNGILSKLEAIEQRLGEATKKQERGRILTVQEAADYLKIKEKSTLYTWARRGQIPHKRVGSRIFFDTYELDEWMTRKVEARKE